MTSRFLHLALGLGLLFALPACDSEGPDDGDEPTEFLCTVPNVDDVQLGRFVAQVEEDGQFETRVGEARWNFVEEGGATYYVLQLNPDGDGEPISLYEERDAVLELGTHEFSAFGPIQAFVDTGSGYFGGPGELAILEDDRGMTTGTFSFGLLTSPGDTDTASACGAFKAGITTEIDPGEVAGPGL